MNALVKVGEEPNQQELAETAEDTILLVESHSAVRFKAKSFLEAGGYRVVEAADGREAVEATCHERPSLILMDLGLPLLDGYATIHRIRRQPGLRDVPIVCLCAHDSPETRADAFAAGCVEYIVISIDFGPPQDASINPDQLLNTVDRILGRKRGTTGKVS